MSFQFPKITTRPINLLNSQYQNAFQELKKSQNLKSNGKKSPKKISFYDHTQENQNRKNSQIINDLSSIAQSIPEIYQKNTSLTQISQSPQNEKYKLRLEVVKSLSPIAIPHLNKKTTIKHPILLSNNKIKYQRRQKTEVNEEQSQQVYKIQHHYSIQTVQKRQKILVKNIQSLIQLVNSSRDEKIERLFDKFKHDLNLDNISIDPIQS